MTAAQAARPDSEAGRATAAPAALARLTQELARGLGYDMGLTSLHFNTVGTIRHFSGQNRCKYISNFSNT